MDRMKKSKSIARKSTTITTITAVPHSNLYRTYINSPKWKLKSSNCRKRTYDRCALLPWLRAHHAHHLTYRNLTNEMIIRDIVPLNRYVHRVIHFPIFWKIPPVRFAINWYLRLATLILLIF